MGGNCNGSLTLAFINTSMSIDSSFASVGGYIAAALDVCPGDCVNWSVSSAKGGGNVASSLSFEFENIFTCLAFVGSICGWWKLTTEIVAWSQNWTNCFNCDSLRWSN